MKFAYAHTHTHIPHILHFLKFIIIEMILTSYKFSEDRIVFNYCIEFIILLYWKNMNIVYCVYICFNFNYNCIYNLQNYKLINNFRQNYYICKNINRFYNWNKVINNITDNTKFCVESEKKYNFNSKWKLKIFVNQYNFYH